MRLVVKRGSSSTALDFSRHAQTLLACLMFDRSKLQIDLVSEEEKANVRSRIHGINSSVEIIECTHGKVDPDLLLNIKGFDLQQVTHTRARACVCVCTFDPCVIRTFLYVLISMCVCVCMYVSIYIYERVLCLLLYLHA
jgi:hypothetical protein